MRRLLAPLLLCTAATATAAEYPYLREGDRGRSECVPPAPDGGTAPPPAAGWQRPEFDDHAWSEGGADASVESLRCAVLRSRRRFDLGSEGTGLAALTLKVRYQDGFVAWINGVEVARRRFVDGAPLAAEPHGPESERFYIPAQPGLLRPSGNVLAVEVRPFRAGRAAIVDTALEGADRPRIVRGPYLQRVLAAGPSKEGKADGSASVEAHLLLETDLPTRAELRWGVVGGFRMWSSTADERPSLQHDLRLTGLSAGKAYRYRVTARAEGGRADPVEIEGTFHTAASASHPLRFVLVGDVRSGHDVHAQLVQAIVAEDPDLVLMTGDLVDTGSDEAEWQRFFEIEAPLARQVPIYTAPGNHDEWRRGEGLARFLQLFPRPSGTPWSSFDVAGVHFVLLDSSAYRNPDQLHWLEQDLMDARRRRVHAILACMHHGPWSSAMHGDNPVAAHDYVPLLERAGATVLFSGHDHDYERGQVGALAYVVSGGGGAELRSARCGEPGKRRCPPRVHAFVNEHHYVSVEVLHDRVRLCPKRPDGTALEPCTGVPLRKVPLP
jgi:hypothetical protein